MSNLQRTQAEWTQLFREAAVIMRPLKQLRDVDRRLRPGVPRPVIGDIQVVVRNSLAAIPLTNWVINGAVIGTHCVGETNEIVVRVTDETPGAGQSRVQLFRATGGAAGDEIARVDIADNATANLTAQNASGVTGTVTAGVVTASSADDRYRLAIYPDYMSQARVIFDGTSPEHEALIGLYERACREAADLVAGARGRFRALLAAFWSSTGSRGRNFLRSSTPGGLISRTTTDTSGQIRALYSGALEELRAAMRDETVAGAQSVLQRAVTAATLVEDAQNQGQMEQLALMTMEEWAPDGLITALCVAGADTGTMPERFALTHHDDVTGEDRTAQAQLSMRLQYSDPTLGVRNFTLERQITIAGTPAAAVPRTFLAQTGSRAPWNVTGETTSNTDLGRLYARVTANGANWDVRVYRNSGLATADEVASAINVAAGAALNFTASNGSGLTIPAVNLGAAPVAGDQATLDLNVGRVQNTNGVPDKWTVDVTVTEPAGEFQDLFAEETEGYAVRSVAAAPTIDDDMARAGSFEPYARRDV